MSLLCVAYLVYYIVHVSMLSQISRFLHLSGWHCLLYIYHNFYYLSVDGHLDYFYVLNFMSKFAVNTGMQISTEILIFNSFVIYSWIICCITWQFYFLFPFTNPHTSLGYLNQFMSHLTVYKDSLFYIFLLTCFSQFCQL